MANQPWKYLYSVSTRLVVAVCTYLQAGCMQGKVRLSQAGHHCLICRIASRAPFRRTSTDMRIALPASAQDTSTTYFK